MITLYAKISKYFMVLVGALLVGTIQNFFWKSLHIYIYIYIYIYKISRKGSYGLYIVNFLPKTRA